MLSDELLADPRVTLTVAVNGYDDGASTGAVRRALGDMLGPSDFRKNASRLARSALPGPRPLLDFLDRRLPSDLTVEEGGRHVRPSATAFGVEEPEAGRVLRALQRFHAELGDAPFPWADCSLGNLVFAGLFLEQARDFNAAVARYCDLVGLPSGMLLNVTTGTSAWLAALDEDHGLLASEAEIVDASRHQRVRDIYLLGEPLTATDRELFAGLPGDRRKQVLQGRTTSTEPNPLLLESIARADLVVYAPGTQHSSLFPSYMTPGIGDALAANLSALKVLITNLQEDAEIQGRSAVELIHRALYYLREKGRRQHPAPSLITHYLLNDPLQPETGRGYVPLGRLDTIEDPRLVRIADFEEGTSGRHDARKVLTPFIAAIRDRRRRLAVAVLLLGATSLDKVSQSILEMLRAGTTRVDLRVLYQGERPFDPYFSEVLPFPIIHAGTDGEQVVRTLYAQQGLDYVVLFDSSGRYRGEDIINVVALLTNGRLDAVLGSRRLSPRDIETSYRLRYRRSPVLGLISYLGSHLLSLLTLLLYGRYLSDTLSGVLAVRAEDVLEVARQGRNPLAPHEILARLLRRRADILETPVQYFGQSQSGDSPGALRNGLRTLVTLLSRRWTGSGAP